MDDYFEFDKKKEKKLQSKYDEKVDQQIEAKKIKGIFGLKKKKAMEKKFTNQQLIDREYQKIYWSKQIFIWGGVFTQLCFVTLSYKKLIKMSRKYLKLEGFWPLHFSILPVFIIANFSLIGIIEGTYNGFYFRQQFKNYANLE